MESKACNLQESKAIGLECANAIRDTEIFGMVLIGGAIVHPRWWRLQPTKGNGCASPRRAPPTKVLEEETLPIPPWPSPMKDLPHLGRSSRSRPSPCIYKLLGSTPQS